MNRLKRVRRKEVDRLARELNSAIERLRNLRTKYPTINQNDSGYYIDGSFRDDLEAFGGTVCPSYHMWAIGSLRGRSVYIFQELNRTGWNSMTSDDEDFDIDTFGLAIMEPGRSTYHGQSTWVGRVRFDELVKDEAWSIDHIILVTDMLADFFSTEDAFFEEVHALLGKMVHNAAPDYRHDKKLPFQAS